LGWKRGVERKDTNKVKGEDEKETEADEASKMINRQPFGR